VQVVGIVLAVVSGVLIGSSFVFKKRGLLRSQAGHTAGEGVAYLKSVRSPPCTIPTTHGLRPGIMVEWHDSCVVPCHLSLSKLIVTVMILGELCNFAGA
jgi:Magnesium transporter NIPA